MIYHSGSEESLCDSVYLIDLGCRGQVLARVRSRCDLATSTSGGDVLLSRIPAVTKTVANRQRQQLLANG